MHTYIHTCTRIHTLHTHTYRQYQQQLDMEKAEQLKRPTEDLEVRETSALSPLSPLGWIRLPAEAFSNLLMVVEFSHSFDEFLEMEPIPPQLGEVYLALYNGGGGKVLMELCGQLLKAAIYDPSELGALYLELGALYLGWSLMVLFN